MTPVNYVIVPPPLAARGPEDKPRVTDHRVLSGGSCMLRKINGRVRTSMSAGDRFLSGGRSLYYMYAVCGNMKHVHRVRRRQVIRHVMSDRHQGTVDANRMQLLRVLKQRGCCCVTQANADGLCGSKPEQFLIHPGSSVTKHAVKPSS
jgi:hypothetical protein